MIIRKLFKFEGAHVVRNCSSERCRKSLHGHSYIVEVFLEADQLDNGYMVYDFGLMKGTIGNWIDSFDHTYVMWEKESDEFKNFIKKNSDRWIELPVSPSAESFSLLFFLGIQSLLASTVRNNGEDSSLRIHSVRVHETATGYAEAFEKDILMLSKYVNPLNALQQITYSEGVRHDWTDALCNSIPHSTTTTKESV